MTVPRSEHLGPNGSRFPFPSYPRGWYGVQFSHEVEAGTVHTIHYFGRDIVLFRTQSGALSAVDRTCPHLGAHLGGGKVVGECLRCPFHDWAFDHQGTCVEVPYAAKIPPKARVSTWPVREQGGVIFLYYCPQGHPPAWEPPHLPDDGWTANRYVRWEIRSHPQEVAENTVDCAHLQPVHDTIETKVVEVEQSEHVMRVLLRLLATGTVIDMPDELNEVELDVTLHGLGHIVSQTHVLTAGLRTRQRIHPTPIDRERIAILAVTNTQVMPDPGYTAEIDDIFYRAFVADFARDFPIWENKSYLEKPLLAAGDGPIGRYRRWARQFYHAGQAGRTEAASVSHERADSTGMMARALQGFRRLMVREGATRPDRTRRRRRPEHWVNPDVGPTQPVAEDVAVQPRFSSVEAYFTNLEQLFDPQAAGDLRAVFQWRLSGDAARDVFAEVKDGAIRVASGLHDEPTLTIEMSADDYLAMINGALNGARAFATGRGRLQGPVRLAMRMQRLFPLERTT